MIQEAISFVKEFEDEAAQSDRMVSEHWKGKKFIIINTQESDGKLTYGGYEILENNKQIEKWLNKNQNT